MEIISSKKIPVLTNFVLSDCYIALLLDESPSAEDYPDNRARGCISSVESDTSKIDLE